MDKVQVNLHVLMLHRVGGEVDRVDIVIADKGDTLKGYVELVEEPA
jgi:hypothetical protein